MSSEESEIKEFIAYEKIKKYSPVFLFYCSKNDKNYVYVTQNLVELDKGKPYVIGVCINSPGKGKIAKVIIKGTTKVRYFGSYPSNNLNIYVSKSFNNVPLSGVVSGLEKGIIPLNYQSSFILKVGTVYPIKCGKSDKDIKARLVNINLDINNESFDLYNIYTFDLLPKDNIYEREFSFYQIGQDLNIGLNNPIVTDKFNLLLEAYTQQVPLKDLCFATDQYCQALFDTIPNPFLSKYEKRLTVLLSNGQPVFESNNKLRIYDYKKNDFTKINLIENHFEKNSFPLYTSLVNAPYWAYVDNNDSNGKDFLETPWNFPMGAVYEFVQADINGIGIGSRYPVFGFNYNYYVAYYLGITNSYNANDGEALLIRIAWKLK
jgi:hypothetical protein